MQNDFSCMMQTRQNVNNIKKLSHASSKTVRSGLKLPFKVRKRTLCWDYFVKTTISWKVINVLSCEDVLLQNPRRKWRMLCSTSSVLTEIRLRILNHHVSYISGRPIIHSYTAVVPNMRVGTQQEVRRQVWGQHKMKRGIIKKHTGVTQH